MKKSSLSFIIFLIILFSIVYSKAYSQELVESRQASYLTYIYKLTNEEAKKIYQNDIWEVNTSFFHTLVDSFPTDNQYNKYLAQGHYLKAFADKNKEMLSIMTVQNFDVFIVNNNTDLNVQVYDLKGNIINEAEVVVRSKKLHFEKNKQSYVDRKSNQKGLLTVTHNGFSAYYNLSRVYNNSSLKRGTRKVVYGTPLKYVWIPINFIIHLPIDGVKSLVRGWPQGTIRRTSNFFVRSFYKVACMFDDYYCGYNSNNKFENKHTGYIAFNKPKYLPGDTVKFKAYLVKKSGKPVKKPVKVILQTGRKNIELTTLMPYRESGGYAYEFFLHDSLQLKLDRRYTIYLELNDFKEYIYGSFKYEDYELAKNKLSLRVEKEEQFKNQKIKLIVKGTDENDLNLFDARLEILVTPKSINKFFEKNVFVPDTILFIEKKLNPVDDTEVFLPDATFPKINFSYNVNVRLLTSDNEVTSKSVEVDYYYDSEGFKIELLMDSIKFTYSENGTPKSKKVTVVAEDNFGNGTQVFMGNTPCIVQLNPYYSLYTIKSDSLSKSIDISSEFSLIQCFSDRTKDSTFIVVENPRKIPFNYSIYKKNSEQSAGYAYSLKLAQKSNSKQNYFVSIRYLWGGRIMEDDFRIPIKDKKLNVSVTQPRIVFPGQKTHIEILVTDAKDNPVEGVDLTAYSITKKFDYSPPTLPYLGKSRKNKVIVNNFNFKDYTLSNKYGVNLDYYAWKLLSGLDSIEYYKFIYPENSIYRSEYYISDSITQFAPFVVSKGAIQPIHVIYVDSKPIYFSWSTHSQPYSFKIDSGYHQIKLRTSHSVITIDSIYFVNGKKSIISLNEHSEIGNVNNKPKKSQLDDSEKRALYKYIIPYRNNFGDRYSYLEKEDDIQFLKPKSRNQTNNNFAGPLVGTLSYNLLDSLSINFEHEPYFEYEFLSGLLKMRSLDIKTYPENLTYYNNIPDLSDSVISKKELVNRWSKYLDSKRYNTARYIYPNSTKQGAGRLLLNLSETIENTHNYPLNILVLRYDNHEFLRVYPGNTKMFHQLQKGYHKLILFYTGAKYHIADSVMIQPNGLNYLNIFQPIILKKDTFSTDVSKIIEETIFKPGPFYDDNKEELKRIYNHYRQQFKYSGVGELMQGYVYDKESDEPIPGVNVIVEGTTYGTVTDLEGYYSLKVPLGKNLLNFSFIGLVTKQLTINNYNKIINVYLEADVQQLEEVVVVGYGARSYQSTSYAVAQLNGRVAGVTITADSGIPGSGVEIRVRGASSIKLSNTPLYIINGSIYTGNISELDSDLIQSIEILKSESATAIYGSRGANGVVIIETKAGTFKPAIMPKGKETDLDESFLEASSQSSSIRNNFSDYAFWKPKLVTDKEGKASFDVTFPDDITSWKTYYLAMNGKRQTGQEESLIKSYKTLMAQLLVPRFLVQNDTAHVIGKVLNYSSDSVKVATQFDINDKNMYSNTQYCTNSIIDILPVIAGNDTLSIKYFLEKEEGYFDGEVREIPVFPIGLEETKGNFYVLDNDTTLTLNFDPNLGEVSFYARADILNVLEDEIDYLIKYKYACNEQIASKLKALLAKQIIALNRGKKNTNKNEVDKLIRLIGKNQKDNGLWGWWRDSKENDWISLHVLEAIIQAEKLGYETKIDKNVLIEDLIWKLESSHDFNKRIRALKMLNLLDSRIDYSLHISNLEKAKKLSLNELLQIINLKQLNKLDYDLDTLEFYKETTLFGNIYFTDKKRTSSLLVNDVQNTLLAYKVLKVDSMNYGEESFKKMRNYFIENKRNGYWRNTYESAQIIETILPDLLRRKTELVKPSLTFRGYVNKTISDFPFEMKLEPEEHIEIYKSGDFPIYITNFQKYWNSKPSEKRSDFEIYTTFNPDSTATLVAGKETKLIVKVTVKKDAEYIMINIPIPAGCSYADKKSGFRNEAHREYFKNETVIFCEYLSEGEYIFEINLIPRYTGTYTVNPAKIELMYFPTFSANNEIKTVNVK